MAGGRLNSQIRGLETIGYYKNTGIEFFRSDCSGITDANGDPLYRLGDFLSNCRIFIRWGNYILRFDAYKWLFFVKDSLIKIFFCG